MAISGSTVWGHANNTTQTNTRTFNGNWTGNGTISGSGDAEKLTLGNNQTMESEVVDTGNYIVKLQANVYGNGNNVTIQYRTDANETNIANANYANYSAPFNSSGFTQIKLSTVADAIPCSGVFWGAPGNTESFEKGANQTCTYAYGTTGWTISNNGGNLDLYNTGYAFAGTHSLKMITASDHVDRLIVPLEAADADFYFRFYLKVGQIGEYSITVPVNFSETAESGGGECDYHSVSGVQIKRETASTYSIQGCTGGLTENPSTYKFDGFGTSDELRVDLHIVRNGTNSMVVYKLVEGVWTQQSSDQPGTEISWTGLDYPINYINFPCSLTLDTSEWILYLDAIKVHSSGSEYIGGE